LTLEIEIKCPWLCQERELFAIHGVKSIG
jgi:hypothetical protein